MTKNEIIKQINQNILDLIEHYDYNNLKIEINCNSKDRAVKLSITEFNISA